MTAENINKVPSESCNEAGMDPGFHETYNYSITE